MPVKPLPSHPNLTHLKHQAKDLLQGHAAREASAAQRMREFHPRFRGESNEAIFSADFGLASAQFTIAREYGFASWAGLKARVEDPPPVESRSLPHHERIEDAAFRRAVDLLDAGDAVGLRAYLKKHPGLVRQRVAFDGENYFRNPSLLEFAAENPIRHRRLPDNIVEVAAVVIAAGAERAAIQETLGLVSSGCVARECGVQLPLIALLCDHGADPGGALLPAVSHGEWAAVEALLEHGARLTLTVAAALGRVDAVRDLLAGAGEEERHGALALAAKFGHAEVVRLLLEAGVDPNGYNPMGLHAHSTPLHQAAFGGHMEVVRLLVERGASTAWKDILWQGTAADWARHGGRMEIAAYLDAQSQGATG